MNYYFLSLHLAGAIITGVLIIRAFAALIKDQILRYKPLAFQIAFAGAFQLITGSLLIFADRHAMSLASACSRIGMYLGLVIFAEIFLYRRMRNEGTYSFPTRAVFSSLSGSLVIVILALFTHYQ